MFIFKKHISRRAFIKSATGATVALPFLDAMVPSLTSQSLTAAKPQMRFGAIYFPQGSVSLPTAPAEMWHPTGTGSEFEFTRPTKPLEPFRDQVTLLSGLARRGTNGSHMLASCMWLNSAGPISHDTSNFRTDTTIDQRIAAKIGQDSVVPSLELGVDDFAGNAGGAGSCGGEGYSCIYWSTLSWRTPTTPLPLENNPRMVFERMFGTGGSAERRLMQLQDHRSMLDTFSDHASRLKGVLGPRDRTRLDQYLEDIREVERRIQNSLKRAQEPGGRDYQPDAPAGVPDSYDEHVKLQYDLAALALQTDFTRVFTLMYLHEGANMAYPAVGILDGDHALSHHGNDPNKMQLRIGINTYQATLFARFLDKLRSTHDGDGTLLDHTLLMYGSGMGNGNVHDHTNLPLVIAGGKSFGIKGGRHLASPIGTPLANLLLTITDKFGLEIDKIDNSTGKIDL
jgi:hypothetical protein